MEDRAEFLLERDRSEGQIRENKAMFEVKTRERIGKATYWAASPEDAARTLTGIIRDMIQKDSVMSQWVKSEVYFDGDSVSDCLNQVCIELGLSDEDFAPDIQDQGHEFCLRLQ